MKPATRTILVVFFLFLAACSPAPATTPEAAKGQTAHPTVRVETATPVNGNGINGDVPYTPTPTTIVVVPMETRDLPAATPAVAPTEAPKAVYAVLNTYGGETNILDVTAQDTRRIFERMYRTTIGDKFGTYRNGSILFRFLAEKQATRTIRELIFQKEGCQK